MLGVKEQHDFANDQNLCSFVHFFLIANYSTSIFGDLLFGLSSCVDSVSPRAIDNPA